jgi:hypothetical protein
MDPAILVQRHLVFTGLARAAMDNFAVILVGIHDPRHGQLLEIAEAGGALSLLAGPVQGGEENGHQDGDNGDDNQQLDQSESFVPVHGFTSTVHSLTSPHLRGPISRLRRQAQSFMLNIVGNIGRKTLHKSTFFVYNFTMPLGGRVSELPRKTGVEYARLEP